MLCFFKSSFDEHTRGGKKLFVSALMVSCFSNWEFHCINLEMSKFFFFSFTVERNEVLGILFLLFRDVFFRCCLFFCLIMVKRHSHFVDFSPLKNEKTIKRSSRDEFRLGICGNVNKHWTLSSLSLVKIINLYVRYRAVGSISYTQTKTWCHMILNTLKIYVNW